MDKCKRQCPSTMQCLLQPSPARVSCSGRLYRAAALGGRIVQLHFQPTSTLTAAVISASAFLASAKYMPVFGSVYSSLSIPA